MKEAEDSQISEADAPQTLASWQIHAFPHYERGALWYVLAGIFGGGLIVTAFMTGNFLLAIIVVMVGIVVLIHGGSRPPVIDVEITSIGIKRGSEFINYRSISRFSIIYDPPIRSLYLTVPRSVFSTLHIPIDGQDPIALREVLKRYVKEDLERDHEPLSESISRIFKI